MTQATQTAPAVRDFRTWRKDVGVAIVVVVALVLGLILKTQVEGRTTMFQSKTPAFSLAYPATWGGSDALKQSLLYVVDPRTDSAFKTSLTVENRGLDPQSPPTLQQLVDRRVTQRGALTGYHLLATSDASVGGAKANRQEYAYIVQPLDQARRASLPVVVHAIEYIVVTKDNSFYITLAAPESAFASANAWMDEIIESVKVQ
ncbi:MAG: hypothetical protein ABI874_05055 [Chloroflexota bacterium]